jgi:hypothetical protein
MGPFFLLPSTAKVIFGLRSCSDFLNGVTHCYSISAPTLWRSKYKIQYSNLPTQFVSSYVIPHLSRFLPEQVYKAKELIFACNILTTSSRCSNPRIGITRSTFLLKLGNKALPISRGTSAWGLRRGSWLFRSWVSGLGSAKLASSCLRPLKEPRAAETRPGIMRLLVCYEDILKEKEKSWSSQMSVLNFLKFHAGPAGGHWLLLYIITSYSLRAVPSP